MTSFRTSAFAWAEIYLRIISGLVRPLGFEPRTCGLRVRCSAVELEALGVIYFTSGCKLSCLFIVEQSR